MAIRSTNSDRPSKAMSGTGNRGRENRDGPGNKPVDYGQRPPGSKSKQERWDSRVEEWGLSPWYDRQGNQIRIRASSAQRRARCSSSGRRRTG